MDELIACPQCGAPAQITERFWLASTAGPVQHLKTGCLNHHWLTPLAETLQETRRALPGEVPAPPPARAGVRQAGEQG